MSQSGGETLDDLSADILRELASAPAGHEVSLPRLSKQLGLSVSVLMRRLSLMGKARLGGVDGPGWVSVKQLEDRWTAALTDAGRLFCAEHLLGTGIAQALEAT